MRFSWKASVSCPTVDACSLAGATRVPSGRSGAMRARSASVAMRSMRETRSPRRKSRWAAADVEQHHRLEDRRLFGGGGVGDPRHLERLDAVLHAQAQGAAEGEAVARGEGRADDGRLRVHEDAREAGLGERAAAEVVAEGRVGERVEAEDVQRLAVEVERRRVALDDRRALPQARLDADPAEDVLRQARRAAAHLVRGPPRHRLGAAQEAALRARVREVDGDDDGHAERHAEDHEAGVQGPAHEVAQPGEQQGAGHAGLRRGSARAARRGRPRS